VKFIYIGDDNQPPQKIKFMGEVEFSLHGEPVDVENERLIEKLSKHRCFKKAEAPKPKAKAKPKAKVEPPISFE
jgi:hypothetical protein